MAGHRQNPSTLRPTRQRNAIAEALSSAGGFLTAQEIYEALRERGGKVGLTTVYRTLQALAESGEIDVVRNETEALYRRCYRVDHHHHLVCRSCGTSVEIDSPEVETWADSVASVHGFADVTHTVEIYGLCKTCR
ncbi:MAG: Fur family transcriptional regulator [Actinomycetota bacterium]